MATHEGAAVVVVNDDRGVLELVEEVLGEEGYRVATAEDAEDGYRLVAAASPRLAILDVRMPGVPDWHVLDRLKANPATASVPVLICSESQIQMREAEARLHTRGASCCTHRSTSTTCSTESAV